MNKQTPFLWIEAGSVFPTTGKVNWVAPCTLTKAQRCCNGIDGEVKWEYAFLWQSSGIDSCLKETKLMDLLSSDGAQIIAVAKEQLASLQNAIGYVVTRMHGFQLVAELA